MPVTSGGGKPWRIRRRPGDDGENDNDKGNHKQQKDNNGASAQQHSHDSYDGATMQQQQQQLQEQERLQQLVSSSIRTTTSSATTSSTRSNSNNSSSEDNNENIIAAADEEVRSGPLWDKFVDRAFSGRRELQSELRRIDDDFRIHVEEQEEQLESSLSLHDLDTTYDDSMDSNLSIRQDDTMDIDNVDNDESLEKDKDISNQLDVSLSQQDDNNLEVSLSQLISDDKDHAEADDSLELHQLVDDEFREEEVQFHDAYESMDSLINQEIDLTFHESQGTIEVLLEDQNNDIDSDSELLLYDAGGMNDDDDESYFELHDEGGINDHSEGSNSGYFELRDEGGINEDSIDDTEDLSKVYLEALQSEKNHSLYDSQELQEGVHLDAVAERLFPELPKLANTSAVTATTTTRKKNVGDNITTIISSISRSCFQPTKLQHATTKLQPPLPVKSKLIKFSPTIEIPSTRKYGNYDSDDVESSTEEDDYIDEESLTLFGKKNHSGTLLYDDSKNGSSAMLSSVDGSQQQQKGEERKKMFLCAMYSILYAGIFGGIGYLAGNAMRIFNLGKSNTEVIDGAGMVGEQAATDAAIQQVVSDISTPETVIQQGAEPSAGAMMNNTPPTNPSGTTSQESQVLKDMAVQVAHNAAGASAMVASTVAVSSGATAAANAGMGTIAKTMSLASTKLAIGASVVAVSVGVGIGLVGISNSTAIISPALDEIPEGSLSPVPPQIPDATTQGSFTPPVPSPLHPLAPFRCSDNAAVDETNQWVTIADFSEDLIDLVPLGTLFESAYNAVSRECIEKFKRYIPEEGAEIKSIRAIEGTADFEAEFEVTVVCSPSCPTNDKLFGSTIEGPSFRRRMQQQDQADNQVINEVAFDIYFNRLIDIWSLKVDSTEGGSLTASEPSPSPSATPSAIPSSSPSNGPTSSPSASPSTPLPTFEPSFTPTAIITLNPTAEPTSSPTELLSDEPSSVPTKSPTDAEAGSPTALPAVDPTSFGADLLSSDEPSSLPTISPAGTLTESPAGATTGSPTGTPSQPLSEPSVIPTNSLSPSGPSVGPTTTLQSDVPSGLPNEVTSIMPSALPTTSPSSLPSTTLSSALPSTPPSALPSAPPSIYPSTPPSALPSTSPSVLPSVAPTTFPSALPSILPSGFPSILPSTMPSSTPSTSIPSMLPSTMPSLLPSTSTPSMLPSVVPSVLPSTLPSSTPSMLTPVPSTMPSLLPSTSMPSTFPSSTPSTSTPLPSTMPSILPSTATPSMLPSSTPSTQFPTMLPTQNPTTFTPANCLASDGITFPAGSSSLQFTMNNPNGMARVLNSILISVPDDIPVANLLQVDFSDSGNVFNGTDPGTSGGGARTYAPVNVNGPLLSGETITVTITFSARYPGAYSVGVVCQGGGNICNNNCLDVSANF